MLSSKSASRSPRYPVLVLVQLLLLHPPSCAALLPSLQRPYLKARLRDACRDRDAPAILRLADELRAVNPTPDVVADFAKLAGDWRLEFTTAPAREVPDEAATGVRTYQTVALDPPGDGGGGRVGGVIYNVIDRGLPARGLRIAVGAEPTRPDRVALDFRTIEASNDRFPRRVTLRFPPRALFRALFRLGKFAKGEPFDEREFKELGHFDVLYLDDDLRIQRNSEGNLFINSRM